MKTYSKSSKTLAAGIADQALKSAAAGGPAPSALFLAKDWDVREVAVTSPDGTLQDPESGHDALGRSVGASNLPAESSRATWFGGSFSKESTGHLPTKRTLKQHAK